MNRRGSMGVGLLALVALLGPSPRAWADGSRDLEDGIAFYENLDLERARERLKAASEATDLARTGRARAYLYLGMLEFELGESKAARDAWLVAFGLDKGLEAPAGTSPKTIAAMESARRQATPIADRPPPDTPEPEAPPPAPPPAVAPPVATPPPAVAPPPPQLVTTPPLAEDDEQGSGPWLWVGIGAGVAAVAGGVVLGILLAGGGTDSECQGTSGGGCLTVNLP